jgi:hypothetical protein
MIPFGILLRNAGYFFDIQARFLMKYRLLFVVIVLSMMGSPGLAISPEAARKELAQDNIPYTLEALVDHVEKGDTS